MFMLEGVPIQPRHRQLNKVTSYADGQWLVMSCSFLRYANKIRQRSEAELELW